MASPYRIEFSAHADRQFRKLGRPAQLRLTRAIDGLADDPRPSGVKRLQGSGDFWRIRVGSYRVVYTVADDVLLVLVLKLGHRRDVYE